MGDDEPSPWDDATPMRPAPPPKLPRLQIDPFAAEAGESLYSRNDSPLDNRNKASMMSMESPEILHGVDTPEMLSSGGRVSEGRKNSSQNRTATPPSSSISSPIPPMPIFTRRTGEVVDGMEGDTGVGIGGSPLSGEDSPLGGGSPLHELRDEDGRHGGGRHGGEEWMTAEIREIHHNARIERRDPSRDASLSSREQSPSPGGDVGVWEQAVVSPSLGGTNP